MPLELVLRKKGLILKNLVVTIPLKYQKYVYILVIIFYIGMTIAAIIFCQPMTEEELRYD